MKRARSEAFERLNRLSIANASGESIDTLIDTLREVFGNDIGRMPPGTFDAFATFLTTTHHPPGSPKYEEMYMYVWTAKMRADFTLRCGPHAGKTHPLANLVVRNFDTLCELLWPDAALAPPPSTAARMFEVLLNAYIRIVLVGIGKRLTSRDVTGAWDVIGMTPASIAVAHRPPAGVVRVEPMFSDLDSSRAMTPLLYNKLAVRLSTRHAPTIFPAPSDDDNDEREEEEEEEEFVPVPLLQKALYYDSRTYFTPHTNPEETIHVVDAIREPVIPSLLVNTHAALLDQLRAVYRFLRVLDDDGPASARNNTGDVQWLQFNGLEQCIHGMKWCQLMPRHLLALPDRDMTPEAADFQRLLGADLVNTMRSSRFVAALPDLLRRMNESDEMHVFARLVYRFVARILLTSLRVIEALQERERIELRQSRVRDRQNGMQATLRRFSATHAAPLVSTSVVSAWLYRDDDGIAPFDGLGFSDLGGSDATGAPVAYYANPRGTHRIAPSTAIDDLHLFDAQRWVAVRIDAFSAERTVNVEVYTTMAAVNVLAAERLTVSISMDDPEAILAKRDTVRTLDATTDRPTASTTAHLDDQLRTHAARYMQAARVHPLDVGSIGGRWILPAGALAQRVWLTNALLARHEHLVSPVTIASRMALTTDDRPTSCAWTLHLLQLLATVVLRTDMDVREFLATPPDRAPNTNPSFRQWYDEARETLRPAPTARSNEWWSYSHVFLPHDIIAAVTQNNGRADSDGRVRAMLYAGHVIQ